MCVCVCVCVCVCARARALTYISSYRLTHIFTRKNTGIVKLMYKLA